MKTIAIEWRQGSPAGAVEVSDGTLAGLAITRGAGQINGAEFTAEGPCRLEVTITDERLSHAADPTMVTLRTQENPFTVLLRDVDSDYPVWIPPYDVIVTKASDLRRFDEITEAVRARGGRTQLQAIANEPEESWEGAVAATRQEFVPTWLGLSRDIRNFELHHGYQTAGFAIIPKLHGYGLVIPERGDEQGIGYDFMYGKGMGPVRDISRRLEDGVLPILHGRMVDDEVTYHTTAFVSYEKSPLTLETLRGTHYLVADAHGAGNMLTPEQKQEMEALKPGELNRDEETVLYYRIQAVNHGTVPRYAWFQMPRAYLPGTFQDGCGSFNSSGRVFVTAKLNNEPMPKEEVAVLVKPGETATFEFFMPHQPIAQERAAALLQQDFAARHAQCRAYWLAKLAQAAKVSLPEGRIDEMVRAGLLHLDVVAYGLEPDGPVTACIGVYCPIGSESSPIIQFMDSMGWHKLAERSLEYFLAKQHDDGFIQNFGGYMLETGPALWSMGEHFRYTRDKEWVQRIKPKLLLAVDFMLKWRDRNKTDELRGSGYGLMEGKVADPEDPFRCFMLNGYAYTGMQRVAEMLAEIDPAESARVAKEAEAFKADLRIAIDQNLAKSPVVPLGDGTWCPTLGPWAEARGPVCLLTDGEKWSTHGAFVSRDGLIGPMYLTIAEVLEPEEQITTWLLNYEADLMNTRNVTMSQPYYSPHPWAHVLRGEVKAFLKEYYNCMSGLADRETYTFWEHFFHASVHKTHEEGWFLMRTRWMLWKEVGDTLKLLPAVPRAWLANGKSIKLDGVASYFGPVSLDVQSLADVDQITAVVTCDTDRKPKTVVVRLPHPDGRKATRATGGTYDPAAETVTIANFAGKAEVTLDFSQTVKVTV
ncbi:MAG: glucosidase family protein [Armatimonadota bacterium]